MKPRGYVYVAGKFEEGPRIREVQERLRLMGFEVTHDWTREDPAGRTGDDLAAYLQACAEKDVRGVEDADFLLVLNHDRAFGAMTEMGLGLAWGRVIYLVGPQIRDNIFFHLPAEAGMRLFPDVETALAAIDEDHPELPPVDEGGPIPGWER